MLMASFLTAIDLWKVYLTGVEVTGKVISYSPQRVNGRVEHKYFVDTQHGRILKKLSHEKVKIGSEVVFIVPNESSYFDDYDMAKKDSFFSFILQDGWLIAIIGLLLFGVMFVAVGFVDIKTATR